VKKNAWALGAAAVAVLFLGLILGRATSPRGAPGPASGDPASARPASTRPAPVVAVGHPKQTDLPVTLSLTADIGSLTESVILPKVSGYLLEVAVRPGDSVRTGQVLAVIDHAQLDAQVAQAQAALLAAQAGVHTARATLAAAHAQHLTAEAQLASAVAGLVKVQAQAADAQQTYGRTTALFQEGAVAQQNVDDAKAALDSDRADVEAAKAQIAQAGAQVAAAQEQENAAASQVRSQQAQVATQEAALENIRLQLSYATIVAPFAGVVVNRSLDPGSYVTPGTSTPILTIADLDHLDFIVYVPETEIGMIHRGDPVQVAVDAYPGREFRGVVSRIAGGADPSTRTVQVEIDIPNPEHLLRPGMYATAALSAGTQPALVVPLSAVVTVGSEHYVWVVADGKTAQRAVTVGRATGTVVEITSGVTPEDLLVVRGTDLVGEGQPVKGVPVPGL
jgi:HlyD family secretion protein